MAQKKTFAFISYSRSDFNVAIDLIKRIEMYAYPKEWVAEENYPYDDKFVRPIFLDMTDLSVNTRDFSSEIREHIAESRYLIVICTQNSAKSEFVKKEIDYFLSTHDNNADLICAVYVDKIFNGMHPVIDVIVATRNCPIYITGKGEAGQAGRKYCFNHILEFLLKVDFAKLYNRYEAYRRMKKVRRMKMVAVVLAVAFSLLIWGLVSENRRAHVAEERTKIEHARVKFERGVFPYSLVVGYVQNFLQPTMKALNDSLYPIQAHMLVYMPRDSTELDAKARAQKYTQYLEQHYKFEDYKTENISIPNRFRGVSITKLNITDCPIPIYKDDARTIVAFKSVIDYKLSSKNPVRIRRDDPENFYTKLYTDSFIVYTQQLLPEYNPQIHFVKDTTEMGRVLDSLLNIQ